MVQCKSSTRFCVKTTWLLHLPQPLLSLHLPSLPPSLPSLYYNVNPKYGSLLLFSLNHLNKLLTFSLIQLRHKCIPTPRLYLSILLYSGCCSCLEFSLITYCHIAVIFWAEMGRHSCCLKQKLRKGLWSPEEDEKLLNYITRFGVGCWSSVPKLAGNNSSNTIGIFVP
jgi:hypothetical protein